MRICFAVDDGPEIEEAFEFYYGRFSKPERFLIGRKAQSNGLIGRERYRLSTSSKTGFRYDT